MKVLQLGKFEEKRGDVTLTFRTQTVPLELSSEVVNHMTQYFLPREPLCSYYDFLNDPIALKEIQTFWENSIKEGAAIVAIADGPGEEQDRILGANVTYVVSKDDPPPPHESFGSANFQKLYEAIMDIRDQARLYERYNIDRYLSAFGLSVGPKYHGFNIGQRILESRQPLCRALGLKVTGTFYSAASSQHISKKIGFKVLVEGTYPDYSYKGEAIFKNLKGKFEYSALEYK